MDTELQPTGDQNPQKRTRRGNREGTEAYYSQKLLRWQRQFTDSLGRRRTIQGKTKEICNQKWEEAVAADKSNGLPEPHRLTVRQFFEWWLSEYIKPKRSSATYSQYKSLVTNHLYPALGSRPLKWLYSPHGRKAIQHMYDELAVRGRVGGYERKRLSNGQTHANGLATGTVARFKAVVHSGLQRAIKLNYLPMDHNPTGREFIDVKGPPKRKPMRVVLSDVRAFLDYATDPCNTDRRRHLWVFLIYTGLRVAEALALRWSEHVDLDAPCVHVEANLERDGTGEYDLDGTPKTLAGYRVVPLTDAAVAALRGQKMLLAEERRMAGPAYQDMGLVFPTTFGTPDSRDRVRDRIKRAAVLAGVPSFGDAFTTYDTRRICASLLRASGVKIEVAMAILGHKNAKMLLEVYASAVDEEMREAARRLQQYVRGEGAPAEVAGPADRDATAY